MNADEAVLLRGLLKRFPFHAGGPAEISKLDTALAAVDRQEWLVESLAEHRTELRGLARKLLSDAKWRPSAKGVRLTLTSESREVLLQILNDIRLGCWHALGGPENLEQSVAPGPGQDERAVMDLAGYFEMGLLDPELLDTSDMGEGK